MSNPTRDSEPQGERTSDLFKGVLGEMKARDPKLGALCERLLSTLDRIEEAPEPQARPQGRPQGLRITDLRCGVRVRFLAEVSERRQVGRRGRWITRRRTRSLHGVVASISRRERKVRLCKVEGKPESDVLTVDFQAVQKVLDW